ncbi:MAG: hypothetical protein JOZ18_17510, partial [Chloroflexi bacterium]|nr:hypothetical protein [Chloroflexota bacterium]
MIARHSLNRKPWLMGLALLLILSMSSCASSSNQNNQPIFLPTPIPPTYSSPVPGLRPFIDTWDNIHTFQTFDYNISDPLSLASHYDFVWGAQLNHVAAFRSGNPNISISFYIPFDRDWGEFPDSGTRHDLNYWQTNHPDWVLYQCDRVTPAYTTGYPNVPLDFTNPAVVSWQVRTYAQPASVNGYDALAVDNIVMSNSFGACGVYKNGQWVQLFSGQQDDPRWRAGVINWLKQMQQALHHLQHPLALVANFYVGNLSFTDPQVQQLASYSDGLLDEDGFTRSGNGYLTGSNWVQRVQFMESVQQQNKPYYIIDLVPSVDQDEVQWSLASYLMGKEHASALFISMPGGYGTDHLYEEYAAQIGSPIGPMYQEQNVYFRNYNRGLSIVNPSATDTYAVT